MHRPERGVKRVGGQRFGGRKASPSRHPANVLRVARAAGIPIPPKMTLYWLRHDWQTAGLEVESAEGVADAAGNSPKVLLSTYAHKKNRRIKDVARKVRELRRRESRLGPTG